MQISNYFQPSSSVNLSPSQNMLWLGAPNRQSAFSVVEKSVRGSLGYSPNWYSLTGSYWKKPDHKYYAGSQWVVPQNADLLSTITPYHMQLLYEYARAVVGIGEQSSPNFQNDCNLLQTQASSPIINLKIANMDFSGKFAEVQQDGQRVEEAKSDTTVSQNNDPQSVEMADPENQRIGFYTKKERQERIRKYKEKIIRWKNGENRNKDRYILRSKIAKMKPRVGGKFAKKTDLSSSKTSLKQKMQRK